MMTTTVNRAEGDKTPALGPFSIAVKPNAVAVVSFDVPSEAVNTIGADFVEQLARVLDEVESNPDIRAAVLISAKPDSFIAGADIELLRSVGTSAQAAEMSEKGHEVMDQLATSIKPVVAAIHGPAFGDGFELALSCHGRVLSESSRTVLALTEVRLGLLPALNGLQRLARIVGIQSALDFALSGKGIWPRQALQLGIADDVVPLPILEQVAVDLAFQMAKGELSGRKKNRTPGRGLLSKLAKEHNPIGRAMLFRKAREGLRQSTGGHYPAPERIIEVVEVYAAKGFEASRHVEAKAFGELATSEVARRLMEVFIHSKQLRAEAGVVNDGVRPRQVRKIGVLGAGLVGSGVAYVSIDSGFTARLKDIDGSRVARGLGSIVEILDERVSRQRLTEQDRDQILARLTTTIDESGFKSAQLIIEAVFEDLELKRRVLEQVEQFAGKSTIFASNTAAIPIAKIAQAAQRPQNVVGMHYFSPVHKMALLEVVATDETSPEVVATAVAVGKKQGKIPIVVRDRVGFYTTRILAPYMNEATFMLNEGAGVDTIDQALIGWGWALGPLALLDEIGIDVAARVGPIMVQALGERLEPPPTINRLVDDDRLGRKNARGFYRYNRRTEYGARDNEVDLSVYADLGLTVPDPKAPPVVSVTEIRNRCTLQFINEALYCWGEGLLRAPRDGDIGAVHGLGFPPFRGGPFRYVDTVGAAEVLRQIEAYQDRFGKRWTPAPVLVEMAKTGKRFYE